MPFFFPLSTVGVAEEKRSRRSREEGNRARRVAKRLISC